MCYKAPSEEVLEAPDSGSHAAKESGRVGPTLLVLRPSFVCFLRSQVLFLPKKMISVKFQVIWTSFGSLKHQNIENRVSDSAGLIPEKMGKL